MTSRQKSLAWVLVGIVSLAACGCSNQQKYDFYRQMGHEKAQCEYMINRNDAARCSAQFSLTYDEYQLLQQEIATETEKAGDSDRSPE